MNCAEATEAKQSTTPSAWPRRALLTAAIKPELHTSLASLSKEIQIRGQSSKANRSGWSQSYLDHLPLVINSNKFTVLIRK